MQNNRVNTGRDVTDRSNRVLQENTCLGLKPNDQLVLKKIVGLLNLCKVNLILTHWA